MLLLLLVELLHQFVHFSFQRQDFLVRASVVFHLRLTTVVLFFVLFWGERHWLLVLRIVRKREVATSTRMLMFVPGGSKPIGATLMNAICACCAAAATAAAAACAMRRADMSSSDNDDSSFAMFVAAAVMLTW